MLHGQRRISILVAAATTRGTVLDRGPFFIIVPRFDQKKRKWRGAVVVAVVEMQCFVQRLTTPPLHVTIEPPFRSGVVEARPCSSDCDFVRVFVPHDLVEVLQILLSPVAAIRSESTRSGMDPRVGSGKVIGDTCRRFIFVDQQRRCRPVATMLANSIPVDMPVFGENEDPRSTLV